MHLDIRILDATGAPRAACSGQEEAVLVHDLTYQPGDAIVITCDSPGADAVVALDAALAPALVHVAGRQFRFPVPFGSGRVPYAPQAFLGPRHRIAIRRADPSETAGRRNLALNPVDCAGNAAFFPHAFANVETRGEAVFAARNAIDGEVANTDHGVWPYTSWGINRDPRAALTIDFGRPVRVDTVALRLRADFPHDGWWRQATLVFPDGSEETCALTKTGQRQVFALPPRVAGWVRLERLIAGDDLSPFPALTQVEVWGSDGPAAI